MDNLKPAYKHFYAVIMAGGGGTRLWPLSRISRPKQMLKISGERTLFQLAVDRLEGLFPLERILIVTGAEMAAELHRSCPEIPLENILVEPTARNTAAAIGLAAVHLQHLDPQAVMAVLTADHFIENVPYFQELLQAGFELAHAKNLVTLGIDPSFPATGYGYIQRGEKVGEFNNIDAYQVVAFKEKPEKRTAEEFLRRGDHDWNSGMFVWRADVILKQMQKYLPDLSERLSQIAEIVGNTNYHEALKPIWLGIQPISIDFGVMEKAERVVVLPGRSLGWNDVGSWEALFDVLPADEYGNIIIGAQHVGLDSHDCLVCAEKPDRLIATIGLRDMIVVDTGDAVLICPRCEAQKVRQLIDLLKSTGFNKNL